MSEYTKLQQILKMYTYNYFYSNLCSRLHLIKICLCCFLDMHLYSNNLSIIAIISSLIISELLPAFFLVIIILFYHIIR